MRRNKVISALLSLFIAFGLWLYVVNFVSSEHTETIHGIPVVFSGETVLNTERNMMITAGQEATVSLTLTGSRSDLTKVSRDNISLTVDLTKVYDPGEHKLTYSISYPGDVANDAFSVVKSSSTVTVTVEKIGRKDVPVRVNYSGSAAENFLTDTENISLDYNAISVTGPSSVVDQIDHARIDVDLEGRDESISESFRYTLCDAEDNPVDVSQVTTNAAEVYLDLKIQRFAEIPLLITANYGGGATEETTKIDIKPSVLRVSGSDAVLQELTEINLGTIDLATIMENTNMTFAINLPDSVTNLSGVTEALVNISFSGLTVKEFAATQIEAINVPEGLEYELINEVLKVTLRGPTSLIDGISPDDIVVVADFTGKEVGTTTVKATITLNDEKYADVGAVGSYSVNVIISQKDDR